MSDRQADKKDDFPEPTLPTTATSHPREMRTFKLRKRGTNNNQQSLFKKDTYQQTQVY